MNIKRTLISNLKLSYYIFLIFLANVNFPEISQAIIIAFQAKVSFIECSSNYRYLIKLCLKHSCNFLVLQVKNFEIKKVESIPMYIYI
jgi:hypothetical protein